MQTNKKLSPDQEKEIIDLYNKYHSIPKVRALTHHGNKPIMRILRTANILLDGRQRNGLNNRKISDSELIEECKTMTKQEIADKHNMHPERLAHYIKRLGVQPQKS